MDDLINKYEFFNTVNINIGSYKIELYIFMYLYKYVFIYICIYINMYLYIIWISITCMLNLLDKYLTLFFEDLISLNS